MRNWLHDNSLWTLLHDPRLRTRHTYLISRRSSTSIGRTTTVIRLLCCVLVAASGFWAVGVGGNAAWWLALVMVPFLGTVLAVIHAREEIIESMMHSRLWPLRILGQQLMASGWTAQINLPGALENVGPLLMVWMVGAPSGPFDDHPAARILAASATLLYGWLATLHWDIDSVLYHHQPEKTWPIWFARTVRGLAPLVLASLYGWLLSRNSDTVTATVPYLAAIFLLLYPTVVVYEQFLASAEIERHPAVMAQRLKDTTVVHSSISNPLHFVLMAVRNRPASDAESLLIYLRGELDRCLNELDHGHRPANFTDVVEGVRDSLLPEDKQRLVLQVGADAGRLSSVDASVARSVLADLCCNALKETRDGQLPTATVTAERGEATFALQVSDDGPGMTENWKPGTSLQRLRRVLRQLDGDLTWRSNQPFGTVAEAHWKLDPSEEDR